MILGTLFAAWTLAAPETKPPLKPVPAPLYIHVTAASPDGSNKRQHLMTVRFRPSEEIEVIAGSTLKGRIDTRGKKFHARLKFSYNGGTFDDEVEIGKWYGPTVLTSTGNFRFCAFAITHDNRLKEFLSRPFFEIPK